MRLPNSSLWALAAGLVLSATIPASATITTVSASGGSTGTLVINNPCNDEVDSGAVLTGCLNNDHASDVNFTSNEDLVFDGGGQAFVKAQDGATQTLTIDPVSFSLNELILDIHAVDDGFAQFCDNGGCYGTLLALDGNGENFFDISFSPPGDFLKVNTFTNAAGTLGGQLIEDSRHWRVDTVLPTRVPEPASLLLVAPFLLLGFFGLRKLEARPRAEA
jgi:hypothetical protein